MSARWMGRLRRREVAVVGMGESGFWATQLLLRAGARPRCSDEGPLTGRVRALLRRAGVPFEENGHRRGFFRGSDALVTSPGVCPRSPVLRWARSDGVPVWSELEFASRFLRGRWAAVTGTNGKTTTATLLASMIGSRRCELCGNVGRSLSRSLIEGGAHVTRVVEASSFQLHFTDRFRPSVAAILNLTPNHLDWHRDRREYYRSKLRIARRLGRSRPLVLNADDATLAVMGRGLAVRTVWFSLRPLREGFYRDGGFIVRARRGRPEALFRIDRMHLIGDHNVQNAIAAAAAAIELGVPNGSIQRALDTCRALRHRIEIVGRVAGVRFVNDSKSTSAASGRAALGSFGGRIVLIAGGRAKQRDFSSVRGLVREKASAVVLYGEARRLLSDAIDRDVKTVLVGGFEHAVRCAFRFARPDDTVLLSPMCASFDQFASYEERGEAFRRIFKELKRTYG